MTPPLNTKFPFTDRKLAELPAHSGVGGARATEYTDSATPGLKIAVGSTGTRTFIYRQKMDGRSICIRIGTHPATSVAEARKRAQQFRAAIDRGEDPQQERQQQRAMPTFKEFAEGQYLPWAEKAKRSARADKSKLANHLIPKFGKRRLCDLSTREVQTYHAEVRESLSAATANRHLALIAAIYRQAMEWGVIAKSPATGIKMHREAAGRERYLSTDEIGRLFAAMASDPNQVAIAALKLLLLTGTRREEALQARWEDVDLAAGRWRLPKTKSGKVRYVTLNDTAKALLEAQASRGKAAWVFPGRDPTRPLSNPRKALGRVLKKAGVEHLRIHDLRHSFASLAVNAGATLYEVQSLLGHSSSQMTQRYAHVADQTIRTASQRVANAVNAAVMQSAA